MTLIYLDTSAVIKLFLPEAFSAEVEALIMAPGATCITSDLTFAEIHGAFSRAFAVGRIKADQLNLLIEEFCWWFDQVSHAAITFQRIQRAGQLAARTNLRGADAIHLVTALETIGTFVPERRTFACFDERLVREAVRTGSFDSIATDPRWL